MSLATQEILEVAVAAARAGGEVLLSHFDRRGSLHKLEVEHKQRNDLVSLADRESEQAVLAVIVKAFPDHGVLAEEGSGRSSPTSEYEWIVDPLDGTTNFLEGLPVWSVSVACRRGDELVVGAVYEPLADNLFSAGRGEGARWNEGPLAVSRKVDVGEAFLATGFPFRAHPALDVFLKVFRDVFLGVRAIRRCGSAALDLAYVAAGIYDGFFEFRLSPWDVAAGAILIEEAGGRVTDLDGGRLYLRSGNIVAGNPAVQAQLLEWIQRHASEALLDELVPL